MGETSSDPQPADPGRIVSQQDFGRELSLLRRAAGLTVRQVARRAALPASTAGDYFAGRHLPPPGQPDVPRRILRACGITDAAQVDQWQDAISRVRRGPGRRAATGGAPYRGLASFQQGDAEWFFGRENLTRRLAEQAAAAAAAGQPLTVVGQSGSGKSSLLRAGLVPALRSGAVPGCPADGRVILLTPGSSPLAVLAEAGLAEAGLAEAGLAEAGLAEAGLAGGVLAAPPASVIVDQFEQVFTVCQDEGERQAFITAICALARRTLVVLGLRVDCYGYALRYADLAAALLRWQLAVGPMSDAQLRRAILEPARRAGIGVSEGLVELLLRDLAPRPGDAGGHAAGALPLLSHALLATWERSRGGQLTVADYQASGGIADAIARTAEAAYGGLSEAARRQAHWLFLALVQVSDDSIETRHRVPIAELVGGRDAVADSGVLARFVDERLITVTQETAEITHDALLAAWPRLREWIEADREGLRIRRRVTDAARTWQDTGQDSAALLRGSQLAMVREWAADFPHYGSLAAAARQFLSASAAHERVQVEAERRRSRRLSQLVAALTVLVLATIGLSGYAFMQRRAAMTAQVDADSRELAVEASQLRDQDPSVAAQLSLAAYRTARTPAALASVLESSGAPAAARFADTTGIVEAVAMSGHLLAVAAADGSLRLWNVARPDEPVPVGGPLATGLTSLSAVAFSPDGRMLAVGGKVVRVWEVTDAGHRVSGRRTLTGPRRAVDGLAFSPDGGLLAAASADGTVRLWTLERAGTAPGGTAPGGTAPGGTAPGGTAPGASATAPAGTAPVATLAGPGGSVTAVSFSPDGRLLAAGTGGTGGKAVALWNVASPRRPVPVGRPLSGPSQAVTSVTFSPDGLTLAAGSQDHRVWLWRLDNPARPQRLTPLHGAMGDVSTVAFSPDGSVLAAASTDDSVWLWNVGTRRLLATLPHPDVVTSIAWAGGHELISGCADGTVRLWMVPPPILVAAGSVNSVAFSPAGSQLAVGSADLETWNPRSRAQEAAAPAPGTFVSAVAYARPSGLLAAGYGTGQVRLWRPDPLGPAGPALPSQGAGNVESLAFVPGGTILASGSDDGMVRLWDVADPARPVLVARIADAPDQKVLAVAISPDGATLAAASSDDVTRLWDIAVPGRPVRLGQALRGTASYDLSVAFSPDGRTLAVGSADRTIRLWNVTAPRRPVRLGGPMAGPEGNVYSLVFSPDGKTLAAGVTDDTVWLWNIADPARPVLIAQLTGPAGHVYSVAFSPDGHTLVAGSADGTVRLWDTREHAAAMAVCATAGQPLTRSEWVSYDPGRQYAPPCAGP